MSIIDSVFTYTLNGIDTEKVEIQVMIDNGFTGIHIVGLVDKTISEAKERVKGAILSLGISLPQKRITVNLSPANLIKEGSHFDLPIAIAVLLSLGCLESSEVKDSIFFGELSLSGTLLLTAGVLPAAIGAHSEDKIFFCPKSNGKEATWSGSKKIVAVSSLLDVINYLKGNISPYVPEIHDINHVNHVNHVGNFNETNKNNHNSNSKYLDLKDVQGQKIPKRALEIAASGGHNLLMYGPPGSGKSMLAERITGIIPNLTAREILEVSMISSVRGEISDGTIINKRPFRAPHHSCSKAGMIGGGIGRRIMPGEISLAHNGVLFLDELPEFQSNIIDSLRQPIETKKVILSRSGANISYPANFQLIAAMNPCKCGYINDPDKACNKAPICMEKYLNKISGPIMDRFDIHVEVSSDNSYYNYTNTSYQEETSESVAKRVQKARNIQNNRYKKYDKLNINTNSDLFGDLLIKYAMPSCSKTKEILDKSANKFNLSMRAYHRILKVARTIADLAEEEAISEIHMSEAVGYRKLSFNS